jgi:predicted DNA-binding transcriptional regulator AlpA
MRIKQIKAQTGLSKAKIRQLVDENLWPNPIRLSKKSEGWIESEVIAIMDARVEGKSKAEIKALVLLLESQRSTKRRCPLMHGAVKFYCLLLLEVMKLLWCDPMLTINHYHQEIKTVPSPHDVG